MASKAISGVGTKFRRWNKTLAAWVALAEINSIQGPGKSRDSIDVTSLDSTGGYREKITGFRDAGQMTLTMNFTRDSYDIMDDDFETDEAQFYEIILPDPENSTIEFEGYVSEIGLGIPTDDKITVDVTIEITGRTVTNSGSGSGAGW